MKTDTSRPKLGCVIRFKNSSRTLPQVLASFARQTVQPDVLIGVDNGSTDDSVSIFQKAGGEVVSWTQPYHHSKVLNFGVEHCVADLVLVLSSHTILDEPDVIERMLATMSDPQAACVSAKWDNDTVLSDHISWEELSASGLRLGSIYSNSMGMIRRRLWEEVRFDEAIPTAEDYMWAIEQIKRGYLCKRINFQFSYLRQGNNRSYEFTHTIFQIAKRHGLKVLWMGPKGTVRILATSAKDWLFQPKKRTQQAHELQDHWGKLHAWFDAQVRHAC